MPVASRLPTSWWWMLISGSANLQLAHNIGWDRPWMHDAEKCDKMAAYMRAKDPARRDVAALASQYLVTMDQTS